MSQQAYLYKDNGDYVVAHNGGENYRINKFKRISSVADYLIAYAEGKPLQVDMDKPHFFKSDGTKVEFPNYWEAQALKDELAARSKPGQTRDLEARTEENEDDFVEESTKQSLLGHAISMVASIIKF